MSMCDYPTSCPAPHVDLSTAGSATHDVLAATGGDISGAVAIALIALIVGVALIVATLVSLRHSR